MTAPVRCAAPHSARTSCAYPMPPPPPPPAGSSQICRSAPAPNFCDLGFRPNPHATPSWWCSDSG
jgi:hypothetical protein